MSREIDARVALEVMEREVVYANGELVFEDSPSPVGEAVPFYSTDMNSAMEVVAKMRDEGSHLALCSSPIEAPKLIWTAQFNALMEAGYHYEDADTPALAICLAALEAAKSTG